MAEASVNVTEGSGKRLHTWDRTIASTLVADQFVLPGEYPYGSYEVHPLGSVSTGTANDHILQLMAGASNYVRIRRIRIEQSVNATTATSLTIAILRLTTAGTGGTVITPGKFDTGDAAAGATAMSLPTAKGTESTEVLRTCLIMRQAVSATQTQPDDAYEWLQGPHEKPIIIPAGTSNGIALKILSAVAAGTLQPSIEFVETPWLGA